MTCTHCGDSHPDTARFCPATGQALQAPAASVPDWVNAPQNAPGDSLTGAPLVDGGKGIVDILQEAAQLYRRHARALLVTAAILFVPGAVISSCALTAVMAPLAGSARVAENAAMQMAERSKASSDRLASRMRDGTVSPEQMAREADRELAPLAGQSAALAGAMMSGFMVTLLGLLGWAVTALILYGMVLPLTQGALTIAVADRMLGGDATWRQHWRLLFHRLGTLISAVLPAALLTMVGFFFFVLPGLVLAFLFSFVAPVALIEGLRGMTAIKRSVQLVRADWLRVALVLVVFGVLNVIAHFIAGMLVPGGMFFVEQLLGDLLMLTLLPFPIIGALLLYFDIRRKVDGIGGDRLREELEALRV